MKNQTISEVIVYHDQTDIREANLNGHVLLFIPFTLTTVTKGTLFGNYKEDRNPIKLLYDAIMRERVKYNAFKKFHFTDISGGKWTKYDMAIEQVVRIGVDALRTKKQDKNISKYPLYCKLAIIFYPTPGLQDIELYGGDKRERRLRYDETLLRILLKGAMHFLYDKDNKVKVLKIISDGVPCHRYISDDRVLWRLISDFVGENPLRDYVEIPTNAQIIQQSSNHKKYDLNSEEYIHSNILQLADLLLGSVSYSCYKGVTFSPCLLKIGCDIEDKKGIISFQVKVMLDKLKRGENFKYSGHYKSFVLSKGLIRNGEWGFENIMTKEVGIVPGASQITLFDFLDDREGYDGNAAAS